MSRKASMKVLDPLPPFAWSQGRTLMQIAFWMVARLPEAEREDFINGVCSAVADYCRWTTPPPKVPQTVAEPSTRTRAARGTRAKSTRKPARR